MGFSIERMSGNWQTGNPLERAVIHEAVEFAVRSANLLMGWLPRRECYLRGKTVLEFGPGQDFGFPLILMGFGAETVLLDRFLCDWDENFHQAFYRALRQAAAVNFPGIITTALDEVIENGAHQAHGMTIVKVGLEGADELEASSIDVHYSNASFEHVADVSNGIKQLARITKPGGLGFHQIDFRDHRDFSRPLEHLSLPDPDFYLVAEERSWSLGNGLRYTEFFELFRMFGFEVRFKPDLFVDEHYLRDLLPRIQKRYQTMPIDALRILGGRFFLTKLPGTFSSRCGAIHKPKRPVYSTQAASYNMRADWEGQEELLVMTNNGVTRNALSYSGRFEEILDTYTRLGYPRELVTHWALPQRDALQLLELIEQLQPVNILEVGTFVGLATLLMATYAPGQAMVHTVDPNFPLTVELSAMHTKSDGADLSVRQQELALRAAQQLGIVHKITFHAGGFSTGATFASIKQNPADIVRIVGPAVCEAHGPFDLIFIDGLHYSSAVLSDLRLAHCYLKPGGRIVLHDVIGCWGSNIRRAVFQFLLETPGFVLQHGRYADIYDSIGVLKHASEGPAEFEKPNGPAESLLNNPEFVTNLASIVVNTCEPRSVIYLGQDRGRLLECLSKFGVEEVLNVSAWDDRAPQYERRGLTEAYTPPHRFDLCICLGGGDCTDERSRQQLVECYARCSDTVLFGCTPPGETGIASSHAQPLSWWVREFWKHGYIFDDAIRPSLEPLKFAYSVKPIYAVTSSELTNLYLVRRVTTTQDPFALLGRILAEKEGRIEDLCLQSVFTDILLQDTLKRWMSTQGYYDEASKQLAQYESQHKRTEAALHQTQTALDEATHRLAALPERERNIAVQLKSRPWLASVLERMLRIGPSRR
jgi:predicted O-methyltransferase YrrM